MPDPCFGMVPETERNYWQRKAEDASEHITRQEVTIGRLLGCQEALTKLARLCIADHEAVERGFVQYAGEFEDAIRSRANLAQRLLTDLNIEQPRSPYAR